MGFLERENMNENRTGWASAHMLEDDPVRWEDGGPVAQAQDRGCPVGSACGTFNSWEKATDLGQSGKLVLLDQFQKHGSADSGVEIHTTGRFCPKTTGFCEIL